MTIQKFYTWGAIYCCVGLLSGLQVSEAASAPKATAKARAYTTGALVFSGSGTWSSEVTSIETILQANNVTFQDVGDDALNAMTVDQLGQFGMLVFPGGEGSEEAEGLTAQTHANIRQAVQQNGVSYLGFCAGSFIAVAPAPAAGQDVSYGLGVVNAPLLNEWSGAGDADYVLQEDTFSDGSQANLLWYGGPVVPNTNVIAKYSTGEPAINEQMSGNGLVVLSGVHPTADQAILDALGMTPDTGDTAYAWTLMNAALTQTMLPHF
jgi:glutamine amidotransferase-like uncharacterized protein